MTKAWIHEKIREAYIDAKKRGDFDCPECGGIGFFCNDPDCGDIIFEYLHNNCNGCGGNQTCPPCKGTGIDLNKNIGEMLMDIVIELGHVYEASLTDKRCNPAWLDIFFEEEYIPRRNLDFRNDILDTFEDCLANVFIKMFELCGYTNIETIGDLIPQPQYFSNNIGYFLYNKVIRTLTKIEFERNAKDFVFYETDNICYIFELLLGLSQKLNIPIEKHISAKMIYNKTKDMRR